MAFNSLEAAIRMTLDRFSNQEPVEVKEEWLDQAAQEFKDALRKQLSPRENEFHLRMSNIGKPLCQLQNEANHEPTTRVPYNHVMRMILGDALEAALRVVIKAAEINVTGSKNKVGLHVNGEIIPGEDDIHIDGAVWDIKSASPFAFTYKWSRGWEGIYTDDTFGYIEQLYGYSKAQGKPMGGWIVTDKSSGEIKVVPATPTPEQIKDIEASIAFKQKALAENLPFKRGFEDEEEIFYKKPTGNRILPNICGFCQFRGKCWPDSVLKPKAKSKAVNKQMVWYTEYKEDNND